MATELGTLAVAVFDFDGLREDNLPFKQGDVITIIEMNDNGWWRGADSRGRVGIFPYNYVEVRQTVGDSFPVCRALHDFDGVNPGDIKFKAGTLITLLRELNADWWMGRLKDGTEGTFPANYVELTDLEDVDAAKAEKKRWSKIQKEKQKEADRAAKEQAEVEKRIAKERKKKQQEEEENERLRAEAAAARERARKAEEELQRVRAETARLKKQEDERKARRSLRASKRVADDLRKVQEKAQRAAERFQGFSPGPAPEPAHLRKEEDDDDDFFGKPAEAPPMPVRRTQAELDAEREAEEQAAAEAAAEEPAPGEPSKPKFKYNSKFANLGGGSRCTTCNKPVGFADKVKAFGNEYHTNCFKCSTCSKVLRQGEWREHGGFPYCVRCYGIAHGPKGFGFGGVVVGVSAGEGPASSEVDERPMFDVLKGGK